jgi:hypothetical protein
MSKWSSEIVMQSHISSVEFTSLVEIQDKKKILESKISLTTEDVTTTKVLNDFFMKIQNIIIPEKEKYDLMKDSYNKQNERSIDDAMDNIIKEITKLKEESIKKEKLIKDQKKTENIIIKPLLNKMDNSQKNILENIEKMDNSQKNILEKIEKMDNSQNNILKKMEDNYNCLLRVLKEENKILKDKLEKFNKAMNNNNNIGNVFHKNKKTNAYSLPKITTLSNQNRKSGSQKVFSVSHFNVINNTLNDKHEKIKKYNIKKIYRPKLLLNNIKPFH